MGETWIIAVCRERSDSLIYEKEILRIGLQIFFMVFILFVFWKTLRFFLARNLTTSWSTNV
jgi:hypothetical protein